MRLRSARFLLGAAALAVLPALGELGASDRAAAREPDESTNHVHSALPVGGVVVMGSRAEVARAATVDFTEMGLRERMGFVPRPPVRTLVGNEQESEPAEPLLPSGPAALAAPAPFVPFAASPPPGANFVGLDDVPMADSSYIVIPPDVSGAVGPTRILQGSNNNYRVQSKSDGAVLATVGTASFWNPVVADKRLLNQLTDPRTLYDPIQNRWIVAMQTVNANGLVLVGVSQTSDPAGSWYLYSFVNLVNGSYLIDFPNLGFNRNWIAVAINQYSSGGSFQRGITLVLDYAEARAGTTPQATVFTQGNGSHFCSSPCATLSATEDTLFVVSHLSSPSAAFEVDAISGPVSAPVYTTGGALTRPGGGWAQPGGNILPQSAPNSGSSSCGATPCPIETQDANLRSAPVYRVDGTTGRGFIYYTQTVGLPSAAMTHTAVQWTKVTPGTVAAFADGGRIEDATATATNGGKWYAFPHVAVNSVGDVVVGYTQFSSAQHPSTGYSYHDHADAGGTIRDPMIYKAGEDYYHKDFGSGRNRWGDFSQACVDPSDDRSLWVLQEYAKTRVSINDGTTGANGSRWSTWWADVAGPPPTVSIAPGPSRAEGASGPTPFTFNVSLSTAYSLPVTVIYQTVDGTATVANSDYQATSGLLAIPAGSTGGTITVNVYGDTQSEPDETFSVKLNGAVNGTIGAANVSTATILNDDPAIFTISASAGVGGTIGPTGSVNVGPGGSQAFTVTPGSCRHVADVLVDGSSVGAVTGYTFSNVQASHTIAASFAADGPYQLTASAGPGGTIGPSGPVMAACGDTVLFLISPAPGYAIDRLTVDGGLVAGTPSYTLANVTRSHIIQVTFKPFVLAVAPIPAEFALGRVIPNPMQGSMHLEYGLPAESVIRLGILDLEGREVAVLADGVQAAGWHAAGWNGRMSRGGAPPGLYFVRLRAGGRTIVQRFVLTR